MKKSTIIDRLHDAEDQIQNLLEGGAEDVAFFEDIIKGIKEARKLIQNH